MTNPEFSNEFDILYNNITSNQAPGLDEYEKSVFLTKGQGEVLRSYFDSRKNKPQEGFDESRKRQMDFSALMKTRTLDISNTEVKFDSRSVSYRIPSDLLLFVNESCNDKYRRYVVIPISYDEYDRLMLKPYQYPIKRGVWRLIVDSTIPEVSEFKDGDVYASISNSSLKNVTFILRVSGRDFENNMEDGYITSMASVGEAPIITESPTDITIECNLSSNQPNTSKYWTTFLTREDRPWSEAIKKYLGGFSGENNSVFPAVSPSNINGSIKLTAAPATPFVELIGRVNKPSLSYTVRYLRKPRPIVLTNLEAGLSIQGISTESECELDESLHQEILQRAVELAKAAYTGDLQSQIGLGQASQTDIGIIAQSR